MPLASFVQRTSLIAAAIGFTAYGVATMPAAAQPFSGLLHPVKVGDLKPVPMPTPSKPAPSGPIVNGHPPIDICPLYKPECKGPPKANPNPPSGGHGPVVINPPPVIIAPPPVVVAAPPPVIARPVPVYAPHPMPAQAPSMSANPNTAAAPSCNCLTKQYLQDGSVLFRDVCTHEAAMATQADLQAQRAAAQNPSQNANQDQTQATPAR
jgi:hypothetical protein